MTDTVKNPAFNNDWLITDTGEIDRDFIKTSAEARARFRYGAECTEADIAFWEEKLTGMAEMLADKHVSRVSRAVQQRFAASAIVGQMEAIIASGVLAEPVEMASRLVVAHMLSAFEMPQKSDRQAEVA